MIEIKDKSTCYGCYACINACPRGCLTMQEDAEGFRYPVVDRKMCTECGLCLNLCPVPVTKDTPGVLGTPQAYAAHALDEDLRARSASGGIFAVLAQGIIRENGVVFGVVAPALDQAMHVKAVTVADLEPMQNSKYLQSDVGLAFRATRKALQEGRRVLFSGTPCQVAGLQRFLGKSWDRLITCDLLCHGVPSAKVYRYYLAAEAKRYGSPLVARARSKQVGWRPSTFALNLMDGRQVVERLADSDYRKGYLANLFQRPSCYTCPFARLPRSADLSLGDYFAYRGTHDNRGLSVVTVNTEKGAAIWTTIRSSVWQEACPMDDAVRDNEHLAKAPQGNCFRPAFFRRLTAENYLRVMNAYVKPNLWRKLYRRACRVCADWGAEIDA